MRKTSIALALTTCFALAAPAFADDEPAKKETKTETKTETSKSEKLTPKHVETEGSVTVEGKKIDYKAVAGTIILDDKKGEGTASIFYAAYFKKLAEPTQRPVMFIYNGGPGSATVWLHMGAFGPKRVVTADDQHTAPAPYGLVNNDYSLLDVSDLVFIDAPGAGFSTFADKEKGPKEYFGVDPDAEAFAQFIGKFMSKYGRWNSPKYLFGESYGTTRSAVLANLLQSEKSIDLNGVILLSQVLNMAMLIDFPEINPGVDLSYQLVLPTYAATAWYHKKLSPELQSKTVQQVAAEAENWAGNEYALALAKGDRLTGQERQEAVAKLSRYTGLSTQFVDNSNLRISLNLFRKELLRDEKRSIGRLDARFKGFDTNLASDSPDYDPSEAAIRPPYTSTFNNYVRTELGYKNDLEYYILGGGIWSPWNWGTNNTYVDTSVALRNALAKNPYLKIFVAMGYYDMATPYYAADYTVHHISLDPSLLRNFSTGYYEAGHMMYIDEKSLVRMRADIGKFIQDSMAR